MDVESPSFTDSRMSVTTRADGSFTAAVATDRFSDLSQKSAADVVPGQTLIAH